MKKLIFLSLLLALACHKKPTEPPEPSPVIDGIWQGSGIKSGFQYTITVDLFETNTAVVGMGSIAVLITKVDFTVSGSNVYPKVSLNMANQDSSFTGTFIGEFDSNDNNTINGKASVPAFQIVDEPLSIKRVAQ
jgi:hypothetical protein